MLRSLPIFLLTAAGFAAAGDAAAADTIRRCVNDAGVTIYTDQPCEKFDATDRKPPPPMPGATVPGAAVEGVAARSDCVRRTDTLLFELRRAIETQNINRLAGVYHWPGTGGRAANGVLQHLERIASRPVASVELQYPEIAPVFENPDAFPPGTPTEDPVGVIIEQLAPGDVAPSFTENLQLVRNAGCWWVRF
jgi:hypothetical protein